MKELPHWVMALALVILAIVAILILRELSHLNAFLQGGDIIICEPPEAC